MHHRWIRRKITLKTAAVLMACLLVGIVSHAGGRMNDSRTDSAGAEFHMARVKYRTFGGGGSHVYYQNVVGHRLSIGRGAFLSGAAPDDQSDGGR